MMPLSRMPKTTKGRPEAKPTIDSWRTEGGSSLAEAKRCSQRW